MSRSARAILTILLLAFGSTAALLFGGARVGPCLGPLGITVVECARATGVLPELGPAEPVATAAFLALSIVIAPLPGRSLLSLVAVVVGAGSLGAATYLAIRPRVLEGFDSRGEWISLARPIDSNTMVATIFLTALIGVLCIRLLHRLERLRYVKP